MFILQREMIKDLKPEEYKILLESYDSLPNSFKNEISVNINSAIKKVYKDRIYLYESCSIAAMLPSGYYVPVEDPEYSVLQTKIYSIIKQIDGKYDATIINDIRRLCTLECYDFDSYNKFDNECNVISGNIIRSNMSDTNKITLLNIINDSVTDIKISDLLNITRVNNKYSNCIIADYDPFGRLVGAYRSIMMCINNKDTKVINEYLTLYSKITGNEPIRFIRQIELIVKDTIYYTSESTSIDDIYNKKVFGLSNVEYYGRLRENEISSLLCIEESGRLMMGENIFNNDEERENIFRLLNKSDQSVISRIVGQSVIFDLNENDCMYLFDKDNELPTTSIYSNDGSIKYLCRYDGEIYLIFKLINDRRLFGINMDNKTLIEIDNSGIDYRYTYDD